MKYYLIAGEASGDLHASNLMAGIKKYDKKAEFRYFGGDLMQKQGGHLVKHYKKMAFMGLFDVIANIGKISENIALCKKDLIQFLPDVIILIDYPGFNLRIAKFTFNNNLKTYYYISPKLWAWNKKRAKKIKLYINKMFVIFPFEKNFYKKYNYDVDYYGNPTVDVVEKEMKKQISYKEFIKENNLLLKPIIALLPGSRKHEIERLLPEMLPCISDFPDYQFIIAGISSLPIELYQKQIQNLNIPIIYDKSYQLLKHAKVAIVTSGTATLETALFNVPQVVCFKTGIISYLIGKPLVNIKYFSLVNIILNKEVVKEFIQFNLSIKIKEELNKILFNKQYQDEMLQNYKRLKDILGETGSPERTAKAIFANL